MDEQQTPPPAAEPAPAASPAPPVSGWAAAPPPASVPGAAGFVYADVPNRAIALFIDAIILGLIGAVLGIILAAIGLSTGTLISSVTTFNPIATIVYGLVGIAISATYFIWSWTTMRSTVGMRVLGMQVGNAFDGKTLTMDQALRRAVALWGPSTLAQFFGGIAVIGNLLGLLAFLWVIYLLYTTATSPTKQGFHDKYANSVVVKAGRVV